MKTAHLCLALCAALSLGVSAAQATARTRLVVYTALEPEQHAPFKQAIEAAVPEVEIAWVWGQTGALTNRILAERDAVRADMVIGLAATSLITFKSLGLLLPYKPTGADRLRHLLRDADASYSWTGMDAYLGVICLHEDQARRERVSEPSFWRDLLSPQWQGRLVMPDPVTTGTGYLLVANWIQTMGEAQAWRFMDALDRNVVGYRAAASTPCEEVATGAFLIGMSYDMRAATLKEAGAPIRILVPLDGVGWEVEATAIFGATKHAGIARRVADWVASPGANALYADTFAVVADPTIARGPSSYPPHIEARMARNDLAWMAANRSRILAEWDRRYGRKAEPR